MQLRKLSILVKSVNFEISKQKKYVRMYLIQRKKKLKAKPGIGVKSWLGVSLKHSMHYKK